MLLCNPMIFPTATALMGLTIFTCCTQSFRKRILQILNLRAVVSPVATAMAMLPPWAIYSCCLCQRELRQKHCPILDALTITSLFFSPSHVRSRSPRSPMFVNNHSHGFFSFVIVARDTHRIQEVVMEFQIHLGLQ